MKIEWNDWNEAIPVLEPRKKSSISDQFLLIRIFRKCLRQRLVQVCLLEMAIAISSRLRTELPLLELRVTHPSHKYFNLDSQPNGHALAAARYCLDKFWYS